MLTAKQQKFCDSYIATGNATQAAIAAGYSKRSAKQIGQQNLAKPCMRDYISAQMADLHSDTIAGAEEVLQYLTAVCRGESLAPVLVPDGHGGHTVIEKHPDCRERLRAAELLGRRYGLFKDRVEMESAPVVFITGAEQIPD